MDEALIQQLVSDYEDRVFAHGRLTAKLIRRDAALQSSYQELLRLRREMFAALGVREPEESRLHG